MSSTLYFDTETTDKVVLGVYPICVQLAWAQGKTLPVKSHILKTRARISAGAEKIHGISQQKMELEGEDPKDVYAAFLEDVRKSTLLVAHNAEFDRNVLMRSLRHAKVPKEDILMFSLKPVVCTMKVLTPVTRLPHKPNPRRLRAKSKRKSFKWPRLEEAARFFGLDFDPEAAHNAGYDVHMLRLVFQAMYRHPDPHLKNLRKAVKDIKDTPE